MSTTLFVAVVLLYVVSCASAQQFAQPNQLTCSITNPSPCAQYARPQETTDIRQVILGAPVPGCSTAGREFIYALLRNITSQGLFRGFDADDEGGSANMGDALIDLFRELQFAGRDNSTDLLAVVEPVGEYNDESTEENFEAQTIGLVSIGTCIASGLAQNLGKTLCDCMSPVAGVAVETTKCELIDIAELLLGCSQIFSCPTHQATVARTFALPNDDQGYLSLPLVAMTNTPMTISQDIVAREGPTYYLAWKAIEFVQSWVDNEFCKRATPAQAILPGWDSTLGHILIEKNQEDRPFSIPIATVARRPSASFSNAHDILIAIRGTITEFDWRMDFEYSQTVVQRIPGEVHRGIAFMSTAIYQKIVAYLKQERISIGQITITGHSVGAAFAAIVGMLLAQDLNEAAPPAPNSFLRVRGILFAPPRTGTTETMQTLARLMSVRFLQSEMDINPEVPCNSTPACPPNINKIPTGALRTRIPYANYPGHYVISASELGPEWIIPGRNLDIAAWHMCAYKCFTTRWFAPQDPDNQCGRTQGTRCPYSIAELPQTLVQGAL